MPTRSKNRTIKGKALSKHLLFHYEIEVCVSAKRGTSEDEMADAADVFIDQRSRVYSTVNDMGVCITNYETLLTAEERRRKTAAFNGRPQKAKPKKRTKH